jgi:T-complex protein 1 subunit gamma
MNIFQAKHAQSDCVSWGVNGENGNIVDMKDYGVWEAYSVKAQTYKTAIEVRFVFR